MTPVDRVKRAAVTHNWEDVQIVSCPMKCLCVCVGRGEARAHTNTPSTHPQHARGQADPVHQEPGGSTNTRMEAADRSAETTRQAHTSGGTHNHWHNNSNSMQTFDLLADYMSVLLCMIFRAWLFNQCVRASWFVVQEKVRTRAPFCAKIFMPFLLQQTFLYYVDQNRAEGLAGWFQPFKLILCFFFYLQVKRKIQFIYFLIFWLYMFF